MSLQTFDFTLAALGSLLQRAGIGCVPVIEGPDGTTTDEHDCALFGSAVLALNGLRDDVGDVDLAVTPDAFERLEVQGWRVELGERLPGHPPFLACSLGGLEVHAFEAWRDDQPEIDVPLMIRRAVAVHGWPCAPLTLIAHHKATTLVRGLRQGLAPIPKHVLDLANIAARMADVDSIVLAGIEA